MEVLCPWKFPIFVLKSRKLKIRLLLFNRTQGLRNDVNSLEDKANQLETSTTDFYTAYLSQNSIVEGRIQTLESSRGYIPPNSSGKEGLVWTDATDFSSNRRIVKPFSNMLGEPCAVSADQFVPLPYNNVGISTAIPNKVNSLYQDNMVKAHAMIKASLDQNNQLVLEILDGSYNVSQFGFASSGRLQITFEEEFPIRNVQHSFFRDNPFRFLSLNPRLDPNLQPQLSLEFDIMGVVTLGASGPAGQTPPRDPQPLTGNWFIFRQGLINESSDFWDFTLSLTFM
jgi:hypothetical protein